MSKSAIIVYDCWDKHWASSETKLSKNCSKINNFINDSRKKGFYIIHNPSECIDGPASNIYENHKVREKTKNLCKDKLDVNLELKDEIASPKKQFLTKICESLEKKSKNNYDGNGKWWRVWSEQNKKISIDEKDYLTERIDELVFLINELKIENLYYVGYHINLCILWSRETSIFNLKKHVDFNSFIVKDLSEVLTDDDENIEKVYSICENEYDTTLINSEEI